MIVDRLDYDFLQQAAREKEKAAAKVNVLKNGEVSQLVCLNCEKVGHQFRDCRKPLRRS